MDGLLLLVLVAQTAGFLYGARWLVCFLTQKSKDQAVIHAQNTKRLLESIQNQNQLAQDALLTQSTAAMQTVIAQWNEAQSAILAQAAEENTRLMMLADSAMEHIKSKSIGEKVAVEAQRKQYDMRLELLRDTLAKEAEQAKKKKQADHPEPRWVVDADGTRIDANQIDWME